MSVDRELATALKVQTVPAVFGNKKVLHDSMWEWDLAAHLKQTYSPLNYSLCSPDIETKRVRLSPNLDA